jgi:hypothetical protein
MIMISTQAGRAVLVCRADHGGARGQWSNFVSINVHLDKLPDALRAAIAHVRDEHQRDYGSVFDQATLTEEQGTARLTRVDGLHLVPEAFAALTRTATREDLEPTDVVNMALISYDRMSADAGQPVAYRLGKRAGHGTGPHVDPAAGRHGPRA